MAQFGFELLHSHVGVLQADPGDLHDGVEHGKRKRLLLGPPNLVRVGVAVLDELGGEEGGEDVEGVSAVVLVLDFEQSERSG